MSMSTHTSEQHDIRREARLRARARRQGLALRKSRRRTEDLDNFGGFMVINANNWLIAGERFTMTLDDIEHFLDEPDAEATP